MAKRSACVGWRRCSAMFSMKVGASLLAIEFASGLPSKLHQRLNPLPNQSQCQQGDDDFEYLLEAVGGYFVQ